MSQIGFDSHPRGVLFPKSVFRTRALRNLSSPQGLVAAMGSFLRTEVLGQMGTKGLRLKELDLAEKGALFFPMSPNRAIFPFCP